MPQPQQRVPHASPSPSCARPQEDVLVSLDLSQRIFGRIRLNYVWVGAAAAVPPCDALPLPL